jgi:hypothetical protein
MIGVVSGSLGRWKAPLEARTETWSLSPAISWERKFVATPTWRPWPESEGASRREYVRVSLLGSAKGEEEMELMMLVLCSVAGFKEKLTIVVLS